MRLPQEMPALLSWPSSVIGGWASLTERARTQESKAGLNDTFGRMVDELRDLARLARWDAFNRLLERRLGARALTWLWLNDKDIAARRLNRRGLEALVERQQGRLTRLTLLHLVQLYFRNFDRLDEPDEVASGESLRETLETLIASQLAVLTLPTTQLGRPDALTTLKRDGHRLLSANGPQDLAIRVREQGAELGETFAGLGLSGFDSGRYGDVCRAHFYLETLRQLSPGAWDDVLDELSKASVNRAPFEHGRRIGHAALEIMIDRSGDQPSESWQNFILQVAGDPRIASTAPNYREWWQPLGESRISQVRGWLSKEDLRLFLQALEQYGKESGKADLQRMFPARKRFLEGLFQLGLIRSTRLMLGRIALHSVKRILDDDLRTSFASMDGSMSDKAVIYLDCGDFHLIEGSHSFKVWIYLAQPSRWVGTYDKSRFSHSDLTVSVPQQYGRTYPGLAYEAVTHNGLWQQKVFAFLAQHGIGLEVEKLLNRQDYRELLTRFGMPVVRARRTGVPRAQTELSSRPYNRPEPAQKPRLARPITIDPSHRTRRDSPTGGSRAYSETEARALGSLSSLDRQILRYFASNPGDRVREAANVLELDRRTVNQLLAGKLKPFCEQDGNSGWSIRAGVAEALEQTQNEDE